MSDDWSHHQKWEADWWEGAFNTYWEETKQQVYAVRMGLKAAMVNGKYPVYDLKGASVCDIGGGPISMLIKCMNRGQAVVVDPCDYEAWVAERYKAAGITYIRQKGEDFNEGQYDEAWCYNVLQHTHDPALIIRNMRSMAKTIRFFEWIDIPPTEGHPHELKEDKLNEWLGGFGKTEQLSESGCYGRAYFGVFAGDRFEKI